MPQAYTGFNATGSGVVFTTPLEGLFRLELIHFTLTTDGTAGVHAPMVTLTDPGTAKPSAELWDWNEAGPSMTVYYTYGIGLRPFNCTITTGMRVEHDLPDTELWPGTTVTISAINAAGATIAGDTITNVTLYGSLLSNAGALSPGDNSPEPILVPVAV